MDPDVLRDVLLPTSIRSLIEPLLAFASANRALAFGKWYRGNSIVAAAVALAVAGASLYALDAAHRLWSAPTDVLLWVIGIIAAAVVLVAWARWHGKVLVQLERGEDANPETKDENKTKPLKILPPVRWLSVRVGLVPLAVVLLSGAFGREPEAFAVMAGLGGDAGFETAVNEAFHSIEHGLPDVVFTSVDEKVTNLDAAGDEAKRHGARVVVFGGLGNPGQSMTLYVTNDRGTLSPRILEWTRGESDEELAYNVAFTVELVIAMSDMEEGRIEDALERMNRMATEIDRYVYYRPAVMDDVYEMARRAYGSLEGHLRDERLPEGQEDEPVKDQTREEREHWLQIERQLEEDALARLLQVYVESAPLRVVRASLMIRLGRREEAEDELARALSRNEEFAEIHHQLARLYAATSRWCESDAEYTKYDTWLLKEPGRRLTREETNDRMIVKERANGCDTPA
ncbi:MAG: hypothetical protein WEC75_14495 [Dehalococcoidia bacterium]